MTQREFYNAIINSNVSADLIAHAQNEIDKLDARNAKRASQPSKTAVANAPLIEAVREFLANATEPMASAEIAQALELTSNKVAALIKNIEVEVSEKKLDKRKVKAYALAK